MIWHQEQYELSGIEQNGENPVNKINNLQGGIDNVKTIRNFKDIFKYRT